MKNNPWCFKIELTEGCNRRCVWCGAKKFPPGRFRFLELDIAKIIAEDIVDWIEKPRMEFTLCGEPTLNKNALKIIALMRKYNKKASMMLTTNGSVISKGNMDNNVLDYFDAGLNVLIVDTYYPERDKLQKQIFALKQKGYNIKVFGKDKFVPWGYHKPETKVLLIMDDLISLVGKESHKKKVLNHGGGIDFEAAKRAGLNIEKVTEPYIKKCVLPFREMIIKQDGSVALCCNDYRRKLIFGNVYDLNLPVLWNRLDIVRSLLYRKNRNFLPCSECNYFGGYRQGIGLMDYHKVIPDKTLLKELNKRYKGD